MNGVRLPSRQCTESTTEIQAHSVNLTRMTAEIQVKTCRLHVRHISSSCTVIKTVQHIISLKQIQYDLESVLILSLESQHHKHSTFLHTERSE
jgi:hypothetical protein